jgi:CheY-like chemotaxis protein
MESFEGRERRRWFRVSARGSVVLHAASVARGRVIDLSSGGMRVGLMGTNGFRSDDAVDLDVHLDGVAATWVPLHGTVVRVDHGREIAVRFDAVPADFEDAVEDEILADVESERVAQVLLVDPDATRRRPLAEALRRNGCHVVELATPLEVIQRIGESHTHAWLIAIAETFPETVAEELRSYLAGTKTRAELIVVGAGLPSPDTRPRRPI